MHCSHQHLPYGQDLPFWRSQSPCKCFKREGCYQPLCSFLSKQDAASWCWTAAFLASLAHQMGLLWWEFQVRWILNNELKIHKPEHAALMLTSVSPLGERLAGAFGKVEVPRGALPWLVSAPVLAGPQTHPFCLQVAGIPVTLTNAAGVFLLDCSACHCHY